MTTVSHPPQVSVRRLVAEAGVAAAHHGLRADARTMLAALPDWLDDPVQLAQCEALLLIGLNRLEAAGERLAALPPDDSAPLHELLAAATAAAPPSPHRR